MSLCVSVCVCVCVCQAHAALYAAADMVCVCADLEEALFGAGLFSRTACTPRHRLHETRRQLPWEHPESQRVSGLSGGATAAGPWLSMKRIAVRLRREASQAAVGTSLDSINVHRL